MDKDSIYEPFVWYFIVADLLRDTCLQAQFNAISGQVIGVSIRPACQEQPGIFQFCLGQRFQIGSGQISHQTSLNYTRIGIRT